MTTTLAQVTLAEVEGRLTEANQRFMRRYPGESAARQPLHTVYGGAHLFKAETASKLGAVALRFLETYGPNCVAFARALELPGHEDFPATSDDCDALMVRLQQDSDGVRREHPGVWLAHTVYERVKKKLQTEPVEDFRIDFEDGYGNRPDAQEDSAAMGAAREVARGMGEGSLPPFIGIRIKPFTDELKKRSIRTLDIFLTTLTQETGGVLPDGFVVTLPKVTIPEQVEALVSLFEALESNLSVAPGSLQLELMIEVNQAILNARGESTIPLLLNAAKGRCRGAHFGTYDYTAACNITAEWQAMDHPVCDFAKHVMQVTMAGTGIFLSDGATNVMPVAPHRGDLLSQSQIDENRAAVWDAWRLAYGHTRHSLKGGFYQGWDLHPAQLPVRYAACYSFFLEGMTKATERLSNFISVAAQATLSGAVFDDAATGQGLLNYFLRALNSGAITLDEVTATGLTLEEIRSRSFAKILEDRRNT